MLQDRYTTRGAEIHDGEPVLEGDRICVCRDEPTARRVAEAMNLRAAALDVLRTGDGHHRFAARCQLLTRDDA